MKQVLSPFVANLEHVFTPKGMPLVARSPESKETTSIVIRGGPGTGKTTLAMALALTVAREHGGSILFVSTETSPGDARRKATDFGVAESRIRAHGKAGKDTEVVLDHLSVSRGYRDAATAGGASMTSDPVGGAARLAPVEAVPAGRAGSGSEHVLAAAMERAWWLVSEAAVPLPIRVVVIDAFSLAAGPLDATLRSSLVDFIAALEGRGISVVLIEEAPSPAVDFVGYVADLVFELSWGRDPDTGQRYRQLGCPKSRHVEARPGPHDFGRESPSRLVVWPPLALVAESGGLNVTPSPPLLVGGSALGLEVLRPRSIVLDRGLAPRSVFTRLRRSPWLTTIEWSAWSAVGPDRDGWALLARLADGPSIVILKGLDAIAGRSRLATGLADYVHALAGLGVTIVVQYPAGPQPPLAADQEYRVRMETERRETGRDEVVEAMGVPPATDDWGRLWASLGHGQLAADVAARLDHEDEPGPRLPLYHAALHALHLDSAPALDWLLTQVHGPSGDLARHLAIPCLARHGLHGEARALLDGVDAAARARVEPLLLGPNDTTLPAPTG